MLGHIGFETSFGFLKAKRLTDAHERKLGEGDLMAKQAFDLVVALLRFRLGSMSWHRCWPGLLALFGSADEKGREESLQLLKDDYDAYKGAKLLVAASPILGEGVRALTLRPANNGRGVRVGV